MKTNIVWTSERRSVVIGSITGRRPTLSMLPRRLMEKYASNITLEELPVDVSEFVDTDGGIYGVRFFNVYPASSGAFLISPTSHFVWETKKAVANDFRNNGAVRGHVGFHAAWPESLERWTDSWVDHATTEVKALVKGYGDVVQGTMGWRSERLEIVSMATSMEKWVTPLVARYGVPVRQMVITNAVMEMEEVEWTAEWQVVMDTLEPRRRARKVDIAHSALNF